jgi:ubiquinone/menaquinone biosynthesis C-methylase UbiE
VFRDSEFTDADWMDYLKSLDFPHLNDWMRDQAERGQEFYRRRLQQIGFRGGRVLDAGCGAGNWTIALAACFADVVAIDIDPVRVGVTAGMQRYFGGKITTQIGSIEALPFPDQSFDAVFCHGVIFLVDYRQALAEVSRVLKPGCPLYMTYNGKGWWRHLIRDRGPNEPQCILFGANGLISRYFMLADALSLETVVDNDSRLTLQKELLDVFPTAGAPSPIDFQLRQAYSSYGDCRDERRSRVDETVLALTRGRLSANWPSAGDARRACDALSCLDDLCEPTIPSEYAARIARDAVSRITFGRSDYVFEAHTYAHEPEDMTEELVQRGFHQIETAHEGCLCLDPSVAPAPLIHELHKGVFECLARR